MVNIKAGQSKTARRPRGSIAQNRRRLMLLYGNATYWTNPGTAVAADTILYNYL